LRFVDLLLDLVLHRLGLLGLFGGRSALGGSRSADLGQAAPGQNQRADRNDDRAHQCRLLHGTPPSMASNYAVPGEETEHQIPLSRTVGKVSHRCRKYTSAISTSGRT